ncbi:Activating signal cointegrator 1 complex subunit 3 ASCC3 [Carpediemonas membranifera]|uniref:Activating signal cointegrator 1 complex subunit 3 ASCC3 n=1 Tax=Carpediemonas membranifera TaxID=201153 RepID=A0A8J6B394_9EUKA|nr:Activating signal cointegrator 1 complex subunit 3 ASCC3 [Carpediemonas membranifera]|eukprot:KAG9393364.1 Activating signal cointegrator 1 complex subunit 3 ASCC3 [Carpediemonas membranifera]
MELYKLLSPLFGTTAFDDQTLYEAVMSILQSPATDDAIGGQLLDLLGFEAIELIPQIVSKRVQFIRASRIEISETVGTIATHCKVVSKKDKKLTQTELRRKNDAERELEDRINADEEPPKRLGGLAGGVNKIMLPAGSATDDTPEKTIFTIPASVPASNSDRLLPVDEVFPPEMVACFQNVTTLNRVQSAVYDKVFLSSENVLLSAPTSTGKTFVALMAILETYKRHAGEPFKVVYIAPMKALAAEIVAKFSAQLSPLGLKVREYTGDMSLTAAELAETTVIVSTPEKWDVQTRKSSLDDPVDELALMILDEVHLLGEDRGPVVESVVMRTQRYLDIRQHRVRFVGLSATLPNYRDVAEFLRVPASHCLHFDMTYRPVPLARTFVGLKAAGDRPLASSKSGENYIDDVCFDFVKQALKDGKQVIVFVHSRNGTIQTAQTMYRLAAKAHMANELTNHLRADAKSASLTQKMNHNQLRTLAASGVGFHHAGLLRRDRNLVEEVFTRGGMRVLVSTATLAWGVNLPAHTVIIKGTELYTDGGWRNIGVLDVEQIFGRAGRPQFDASGRGVLITKRDQLEPYLQRLLHKVPIESSMMATLHNHLNAAIVLGTVSSLNEATAWVGDSFMAVRMRSNPQHYGIESVTDSNGRLDQGKYQMELHACMSRVVENLNQWRVVRYNRRTGSLGITSLGRIASHYYVNCDTVFEFAEMFQLTNEPEEIATHYAAINNGLLASQHEKVTSVSFTELTAEESRLHSQLALTHERMIHEFSRSREFESLRVRQDEVKDLTKLAKECPFPVGDVQDPESRAKVSALLQAAVSGKQLTHSAHSLMCDQNLIMLSASRIFRAIFEIAITRRNPIVAERTLELCLSTDRLSWFFNSPLRPWVGTHGVTRGAVMGLEKKKMPLDQLRTLSASSVEKLLDIGVKPAQAVVRMAHAIPWIDVTARIVPVTSSIIRLTLTIVPDFTWHRALGHGQAWWVWVSHPTAYEIVFSERVSVSERDVAAGKPVKVETLLLAAGTLPPEYELYWSSDSMPGVNSRQSIDLTPIRMPTTVSVQTPLLRLAPLSTMALHNDAFRKLYSFDFFNPAQTQTFHSLYHTDDSVLVGVGTGSGKTVMAELAILRMLRQSSDAKAIYIAPMRSLTRERLSDWKTRFGKALPGVKIVELTGEAKASQRAVQDARIIVTTPEKYDGLTRRWTTGSFVRSVALIIIDELHLLASNRGPVLESILVRTQMMARSTGEKIRVVGLTTPISNAYDVGAWLGVPERTIFNFPPAMRPVPCQLHVHGFPDRHYCPRMKSMNRPTFAAIQIHSPDKPVIVFVSSRRQTRLTAYDLISFKASDFSSTWTDPGYDMSPDLEIITDPDLMACLPYGVGIHHAGLPASDRAVVERLFRDQKIRVLVTTSTLAWGVNLPAYMVVVKGCKYFDAHNGGWEDFTITEVMQMVGRAGRQQYFSNSCVAVVLCHSPMKEFYTRFLSETFPLESELVRQHDHLADTLNAELVTGAIKPTVQGCLAWLDMTFLARRMRQNPAYYLEGQTGVESSINQLIETNIDDLVASGCLVRDDARLTPTDASAIASHYYLSHRTIRLWEKARTSGSFDTMTMEDLLWLVSCSHEFSELPVRHEEDEQMARIAPSFRFPFPGQEWESPFTKTFLLLQYVLTPRSRRPTLPVEDFFLDLHSIQDQLGRVLAALFTYLSALVSSKAALSVVMLTQAIYNEVWWDSDPRDCLRPLTPGRLPAWPKLIHQAKHESRGRLKRFDDDDFRKLRQMPEFTVEVESFAHDRPREIAIPIHIKARGGDGPWHLVLFDGAEPVGVTAVPVGKRVTVCCEMAGEFEYDTTLRWELRPPALGMDVEGAVSMAR